MEILKSFESFRSAMLSNAKEGYLPIYTSYPNGVSMFFKNKCIKLINEFFGFAPISFITNMINSNPPKDIDFNEYTVLGLHVGLYDYEYDMQYMFTKIKDLDNAKNRYIKMYNDICKLLENDNKIDKIKQIFDKFPILRPIYYGFFCVSDIGIHGDCLNFAIALRDYMNVQSDPNWKIVGIWKRGSSYPWHFCLMYKHDDDRYLIDSKSIYHADFLKNYFDGDAITECNIIRNGKRENLDTLGTKKKITKLIMHFKTIENEFRLNHL